MTKTKLNRNSFVKLKIRLEVYKFNRLLLNIKESFPDKKYYGHIAQ